MPGVITERAFCTRQGNFYPVVERWVSVELLKAEREAAQESLRNRTSVSGGGGESQ